MVPSGTGLAFNYHQRFTLSVVPIIFGLLALGLSGINRLQRSPFVLGAVGVMTCFGYFLLLVAAVAANIQGWGAAAAWMPNVIFCWERSRSRSVLGRQL